MTEEEWLACGDAREILGRETHPISDRKLRLFAVACCRCSRPLLRNAQLRADVDLAERFADGRATVEELSVTYERVGALARAMNSESWTEREIRRWAETTAVANATHPFTQSWHAINCAGDAVWQIRRAAHRDMDPELVALLRDVVGNPFRPVRFDPAWHTGTAVALALGMYEARDFSTMPILADALQDAGCEDEALLAHCRDPQQVHVRGCWVVDLVLGKE